MSEVKIRHAIDDAQRIKHHAAQAWLQVAAPFQLRHRDLAAPGSRRRQAA